MYSDLGMLTCDPDLGRDCTEFFNYLTTGHVALRDYRKLLPAPKLLKSGLLSRIAREIQCHQNHGDGLIQFKMNALEDVDITRALYQACQAGVKVDLVVRDTCRLRPGIPGLSDTARVISIVGRFLEHTRIFYFHNNGDEEYLIGSADCMQRNLESRNETVVPVEAPALRDELREVLNIQLADQRNAWEMQPDGGYVQRRTSSRSRAARGAQQVSIELAEKRLKLARQHKKISPKRQTSSRKRNL